MVYFKLAFGIFGKLRYDLNNNVPAQKMTLDIIKPFHS